MSSLNLKHLFPIVMCYICDFLLLNTNAHPTATKFILIMSQGSNFFFSINPLLSIQSAKIIFFKRIALVHEMQQLYFMILTIIITCLISTLYEFYNKNTSMTTNF